MDANKSRILARVLLLSPNRVPRSLVVSRGSLLGGLGRSWAVPVFLLNGNFPDVEPADEDPITFDGEPHPEHGPPGLGASPLFPNWQAEHQGADPEHGVHGGNPHPNQPQQNPNLGFAAPTANIAAAVNNDEAANNEGNEWPAWEPVSVQAQQPPADAVPQHSLFPQDMIDIDRSGSSMRFLRANGPDIPLNWVLGADSDEDSSSSSDATSILLEQELKQIAANKMCADQLIYNTNAVPTGFTLKGLFAVGAGSSSGQPQPRQTLML